LIDWGLAAFYFPGHRFAKFPGTRVFKAPEMLLQYPYYDYAVDMWSFGAMLAGIVLRKHPIFKGRKENINVLVAIAKTLGTDELFHLVEKYNLPLRSGWEEKLSDHTGYEWEAFVNRKNRHLAVDDALDLVDGLLTCDHEARLNVREAMAHPYFDPVRDECEESARNVGSVAARRGLEPDMSDDWSSDQVSYSVPLSSDGAGSDGGEGESSKRKGKMDVEEGVSASDAAEDDDEGGSG